MAVVSGTQRAAHALLAGAWLTLGAVLGLVVITTPLPLSAQAIFAGVVFALALLLQRFRQRGMTLLLMSLSIIVSTRYVYFRVGSTLPDSLSLDLFLGVCLLLAELYAYLMLLLGYLQTAWPLRREPLSLPEDVSTWPTVDVFIPTYNESLTVVAPTVLAARALDWPSSKLRVYLLDDGCRPEFRAFAERVGVEYFERVESTHAKAGNINKALGRTQGEYVAIFDCDHVPTRSFLQVASGWLLRDPKIAMVQTPHHFYSPDPFERNLDTFRDQPNEGELFYGLIQRGNDLWNAAFFCGSCAVLRRSALEGVGGIAVETVTEDAHTALRLQRHGHHTAYLDLPQIGGLATESLSAHVGQRQRWARGMAQIFRVDNPLFGPGLNLGQRLCYAAAMLHFFHGLPRLVFLLAPLSYLFFGAQILRGAPALVLAYGLPHLLHSTLTNARTQGRFRYSFWSEVYETSLAPFIALPTTLALIAPKLGSFNVTAKGGQVAQAYFDRKIALPHLVLSVLNLAGVAVGLTRLYLGDPHADVALLNVGWCAYNLLLLGAALAVARESRQRRAVPRVPAQLSAVVRLAGGHARAAETRDLSLHGASLHIPNLSPLSATTPLSLGFGEPGRLALPARVVAHRGAELRVAFEALSHEQHAALVEGIFSRADTWSDFRAARKRDRPLLELLRIVGHGLRGMLWLCFSPFTRSAAARASAAQAALVKAPGEVRS
jgi:cellulose synthase (UDP-forming)